jgi:hypothetical protein
MQENQSPKASQAAPADMGKDPLEIVKDTKKELRKYRRQNENDWKTFENAYYGKQHKTGGDRKSVKNHVFKIVEGEVPILTDSMPGTQILANSPEMEAQGKNLERAISYVHQKNDLQLLLPTLIRSALISAPGILHVFWDPDAEDGDGAIRYKQLDWRQVLVDGNCSKIEDAEKAQIMFPMRRSALQRIYPEFKAQLSQVNGNIDLCDDIDDDDESQREDRDTGDERVNNQGRPKDFKAKDIINETHTWVKSYELEPIPFEESQAEIIKETQELMSGNPPEIKAHEDHAAHIEAHQAVVDAILAEIGLPAGTPFEQAQQLIMGQIAQAQSGDPNQATMIADALGQKLLILRLAMNHAEEHQDYYKINPRGGVPKYPDGWRVIKSAGDVVLYDGPNPEPKLKGPPLVFFYCYKDHTVFGFGEIKNIFSMQTTLNDVDYKEFKGLKLNANPGWLADHESEVDEDKLTNEDGIVILKNKGTEVRRLEPGMISPQLAARKEADVFAMEDISGVREASQGQMPSGGASGVAIARLQTQAVGRIRLKDRYLQHYSMKRLAEIVGALILEHWTDEKRLRFRSADGKIEDLIFNPIEMQDFGYTVEIAPGSMAGTDRDSLNQMFMNMLDKNQITIQEFLAVAEFPKREVLLEMVKERDQVQQQLQSLQTQVLQYKAIAAPGLLTPEEQEALAQMQMQQAEQQLLSGQVQPQLGQSNPEAAAVG